MNYNTYDDTLAQKMLLHKWDIESFDEVKKWDSQARDEIASIESYLSQLSSFREELLFKKNEIETNIQSKSFFLKPFMIGSGLQKTNNLIEKINKDIERAEQLIIQLQNWMDATPDNQKEANEIITELKLAKKQIDINKKELNLQIKQISSDTKQKINKIERRVFFTSPKLKKLQIQKAERKKDKSVNPLEDDLLELEAQELEVDKLILWYEKIKFSS